MLSRSIVGPIASERRMVEAVHALGAVEVEQASHQLRMLGPQLAEASRRLGECAVHENQRRLVRPLDLCRLRGLQPGQPVRVQLKDAWCDLLVEPPCDGIGHGIRDRAFDRTRQLVFDELDRPSEYEVLGVLDEVARDLDGAHQHVAEPARAAGCDGRLFEPPLQARRDADVAVVRLRIANARSRARRVVLREKKLAGVLRMQPQRRPAGNVQQDYVVAGNGRQPLVGLLRAPPRGEVDRFLDLSAERKPGVGAATGARGS